MNTPLPTPLSARARAQASQLVASDPGVSAFVAASAGSGKTKLLTDRLLRLLLTGADPARIQCLTFTKAAAAEMAVRLQRRLGRWVTLDDAVLAAELRELQVEPGRDRLAQARALFATVLDLPGGMRIGTIHAFCQSLLRRFPLEAQLSPHFRLVDDIDAAAALRDAREDMLSEAHDETKRAALDAVAALTSLAQFADRVGELRLGAERLAAAMALPAAELQAAQLRVLGVGEAAELDILRAAVRWPAEESLCDALRVIAARGAAGARVRAGEMLSYISCGHEERVAGWSRWRGHFLRDDGAPRGFGSFPNKALLATRPELVEHLTAEQTRVQEIEDRCRALRVAEVSASLLTLAVPVVQAYAKRKEGAALLDYDDLIGRTSSLLVDPGAAWVLYKLDGGLDHLLLDEVQDTAPAQWNIAGALTAEFFAGAGPRDDAAPARTVFAVGDRKQSIYSFQGADPDGFELWRARLRDRVRTAGAEWRDVELDVSFRSTAPVLALVDAVFADPTAAAGVAGAGGTRHLADRAGHAGRVELWPLTPLPEPAPSAPWTVPERNLGMVGAPQRLADALAAWIAARCGVEALPSRGRTLQPGDVLVLVRRRNAFARALVRALKSRGVAVAGLDRLVLTEQPAVADLLAVCDTLLLPQDDLSLACVLTSPLGGISDDSLMDLAAGRSGSLWDTLRARAGEPGRDDWAAALGFLSTLLTRVDYVSPHALLVEALGTLGGRARLFARLGPEAAEPVDELLNAALAYAQAHPPSLQGFVHWLRQSGAEVKREAEGAGSVVRIMTVHGAKGLQAPLVILPDTTALPPDEGPVLWAEDPEDPGLEVPLWAPRKELRCAAIDRLRQAAARRREEEYHRLLYVALTRAEDRLLVCGWQTGRASPGNWYDLVAGGFARLGAEAAPFAEVAQPWAGELLSLASPQVAVPVAAKTDEEGAPPPLPRWAGAAPLWQPKPPPDEPKLPEPLAPSRPENAWLGDVPAPASPLQGADRMAGDPGAAPLARRDAVGVRFRRGQLVHALLQHLPALPVPDRAAAAARFLARPGAGVAPEEVDSLVANVISVLENPALAELFGPAGRAEAPLTGVVGGVVVGGLVDRLAVLPDRVLVADYKTNRRPPTRIEDVPALYLRQMAAYRAVLQAIFPGRAVLCALVWTSGASVMQLPGPLLDRYAPDAQTAA